MKTISISSNFLLLLIARIYFTVTNKIYLGVFSPIKLTNKKIPHITNVGEVLLSPILCCLCGTDISKFTCGDNLSFAASALRRKGDQYLGHEVVARVVETSKGSSFSKNQRVVIAELNNCRAFNLPQECDFCKNGNPILCTNKHKRSYAKQVYGGFSELFLRSEYQLIPIPDSISDEDASLIEPAAVALHSIIKSGVKSGDTILIYGAGVIGQMLIKLLRIYFSSEVEIHVIGRHKYQLEESSLAGASMVFENMTIDRAAQELNTFIVRPNGSGLKGQVSSYLNSGYAVVYDFVGSNTSFYFAQQVVMPKGSIVAIGSSDSVKTLDTSYLISREINIVGSHGYAYENIFGTYKHTMMEIIDLLNSKKINFAPYVTHQYELDKFKDAIKKASSHHQSEISFDEPIFRVGIRFEGHK